MADDKTVAAQQAVLLGAMGALFDEQFRRLNVSEDQLILTANVYTAADEPLTVTLNQTPQNGDTWIISRLTMHGCCAVTPAVSQSPISGLFLVQFGEEAESLSAAQSIAGWNIRSRGIPLPSGVVVNITTIPGPPVSFAYCYSLTQSTPLIIAPGQTLRGVLNCNPGTPAPGPGAGSWAVLTAMGVLRRRAQ